MAGSPDPHLLIRTTYYRDDNLDSEPGENDGIPQGERSQRKIKLTPPMREYCQNQSSLSYGSSTSSRARRTQDALIAAAAAEVNLEYARKEEELRREKADRDLRLQTLEKECQTKEAAAIAAALTDNLSNLGSDHDLSRLGKEPPRDRIKAYLDSIHLENKSPQTQTDVPKRPLVYPDGAQSKHPGDAHALNQIKDVRTEVQRQWAAHQQHSEVQEKLIAEQEKKLQALEKELQVPGKVLTTVQTELEITATTATTTGIDLLQKVKVATTSGAPSFQAPNPLNPTPHKVNKSSPIATEIKRELFQFNPNAPDFVHEVPQKDLASYPTQTNTHGISYPPYAHPWSWTLTNFQDLANRDVEKFSNEVGGEYILWKRAFQKAVQNLNLQPDEELFLMVRWLGPTSVPSNTWSEMDLN
ncbi:UNVERIFIED_CONTAM: hypothetical protein K2H54_059728 [Gekko kuhli]